MLDSGSRPHAHASAGMGDAKGQKQHLWAEGGNRPTLKTSNANNPTHPVQSMVLLMGVPHSTVLDNACDMSYCKY